MTLPAIKKLEWGCHYPLTLLIAPAGSGKTRALRDWATARGDQRRQRLIWLTLQDAHNHLGRFLADLARALIVVLPVEPSFPGRIATLPPEQGATALINAIAEVDQDFCLVLDEYHHVRAAEVHRALTRLLDYPPPALHLVIACRSEPPLPVARLRARRQLIEIGAEELR